MKIKESKMEKNLYNKVDAEDWMILPRCSETPTTSFINVNALVLYPEKIFDKIKDKQLDEESIPNIFEQI